MDKYKLLLLLDVVSVIYAIAVIVVSAIFQNYWLLFFIIFAGTSNETKESILKSK